MNDLVGRLLRVSEFGGTHLDGLWSEAAAEIERLASAHADKAELVIRLQDQVDRLRKENYDTVLGWDMEHRENDRLRAAMRKAWDLVTERTSGNPARSPGHNARLILEAALGGND